MSDDDKARRSGEAFISVPPELRGYIDKDERPYVQRRGEDPELDAAFQELLAPLPETPQEIDLTRGAGNQSAYVASVPLPVNENKAAAGGKVEIAVADVPKQLPSGERELKTEQVRTIGHRDRTETAREVPPAPASTNTWVSVRRLRRTAAVVSFLIASVVMFWIWVVQHRSPVVVPADAATALTAATGAPEAPATASAVVPAASVPHVVESAVPPASGSASVPPAPPALEASPKHGGHAAARPSAEDPYRDAAVPPPSVASKATTTPSVAPAGTPAPPVTAASAATPPPKATSAPSDDEVFNRPKQKRGDSTGR